MHIRKMLNVAKWRCGKGTKPNSVRGHLQITNRTFEEAKKYVRMGEMYCLHILRN